jgi:hypothetical protein
MGALPAARGCGAAQALLDDFLERARADGCGRVELECFAQNERALRLYRSRGFEAVHELPGYSRPADRGGPAPAGAGEPVAIDDGYAWLDEVGRRRGDLPLQVTPVSLRAQPFALKALRQGQAQVVFAEAAAGKLVVHSLVDDGSAGQHDAQAVVARLLALHPAHAVAVPQLQRRDLGGLALERLGFDRLPLHQLMMRRNA